MDRKTSSAQSAPGSDAQQPPRAAATGGPRPAGTPESTRLVHELQIHELELELQNQELREAQSLLEESRSRYAELYDHAPMGYCTLDRQGIIREMNLCAARFFGKPRAQLVNRPFKSVVPPAGRPLIDDQLRRCLVDGIEVSTDLTLVPSDEGVEVVEVVAVPTINNTRTVTGCLMALADITARKKGEAERERLLAEAAAARAAAEEASRTKDEFLAVVSHELRTPVAAMLMWTHLLRTQGRDASIYARALESIEVSTRAQLKLLEDLLDVMRGRAGKLRVDRKPVALGPIIEEAVAAARPAAWEKRISLELAPPGTGALGSVLGDEARLNQVMENVISNAIKFTPADGRVVVRAMSAGGNAVIEVADSGVGIAPDLLPHIFDLYRQEDALLGERRGGLGVGLAIVKQLVDAHGGRVVARSPGRGLGTTLTLTLPCIAPASAADDASPLPPPAGAAAPLASQALGGVRVLLVEDDRSTREAMIEVLEMYGANVTGAASLRESRASLDASRPDVLLSDILLPDGDGYAVVRQLRALDERAGSRTPAVALTSLAAPADCEQALAAGFDRHFAKPVEVQALISFLIGELGPPRFGDGPEPARN
jgi:PAS domain S-box-containing protein